MGPKHLLFGCYNSSSHKFYCYNKAVADLHNKLLIVFLCQIHMFCSSDISFCIIGRAKNNLTELQL